ncbi:hypothetical protein PI125_g14361 [Phytophthora idaei]|nr:hypothetical protein PI125_g14361 [Phytophthora idaei]
MDTASRADLLLFFRMLFSTFLFDPGTVVLAPTVADDPATSFDVRVLGIEACSFLDAFLWIALAQFLCSQTLGVAAKASDRLDSSKRSSGSEIPQRSYPGFSTTCRGRPGMKRDRRRCVLGRLELEGMVVRS